MPAISQLFLPPSALAGCVFAAIYRDTRGVQLNSDDRVNHFPASPLVSVTRVLHGSLRILPGQTKRLDWQTADDASPLFVMGPQNGPTSSWSPGEVEAITIGLYHDAWLHLGGGRDFARVPDSLVAALTAFGSTTDLEAGWHRFCAALQDEWETVRPNGWPASTRMTDWGQAAIARATLSGPGRSLRSFERRLKRMSGQTRRSLDFFAAFERLQETKQDLPQGALADIAYAAGYADQSHMGRAVRRATGFTPAKLNKAIQTEEAFWCYRLLGERF